MRVAGPIHQRFTGANMVTFLHVNVHTPRQGVLSSLRARLVWNDNDLAQPLRNASVMNDAINLTNDRCCTWFSGLEELHYARQPTRDVLCFRRFPRNLRQDVASGNFFTIDDH